MRNHRFQQALKVFLLIFVLSGISDLCSAQNISIGATNLLPDMISMPPSGVQGVRVDVKPVDLLEYLRGVCRAELGVMGSVPGGTLSDAQRKEAYRALAIAAATNLAKKAKGATAVTVQNSEDFQTYLPRSAPIIPPVVNILIDEAVTETGLKNVIFYLGNMAEARYFHWDCQRVHFECRRMQI